MKIRQQAEHVCSWHVEKILKNRARIALFLVAALAATALSSAQDATGRVLGTVYDQQGAVIGGAQITVTNTATHVSRTAATDNEGHYQVLALPIGNYKVTAEHS